MDEKLKIQLFLDSNEHENDCNEAQKQISELDEKISRLNAENNSEIVKEHIKTLGAPNGNFRQIGM